MTRVTARGMGVSALLTAIVLLSTTATGQPTLGSEPASVTGAAGPVGSTFRVSNDSPFGFTSASVAYNNVNNEYLVVWFSVTATNPGIPPSTVFEVFGQRIDGATGAELGVDDFQISGSGATTSFPCCDAPTVAFNGVDNEYLVVWEDGPTLRGQRLDGATGAEIGVDDFALTASGVADSPGLVFNPALEEYLLVYSGDLDGVGNPNTDELEVYARRLNAEGVPLGPDFVRISDMGPDGESIPRAYRPQALYNTANAEYMVVWLGLDDTAVGAFDFEVYAQRLAAATAAELGANDMQISDTRPESEVTSRTTLDAVYNAADNEYLVVWSTLAPRAFAAELTESEIRGQRLDGATGAEVGANDFLISDSLESVAEGREFIATHPSVAFGEGGAEYLVVYRDRGRPTSSGFEIIGQRLSASGVKIGTPGFGVSDMTPGNLNQQELDTATVYNPTDDQYLVIWNGDEDPGTSISEVLFGGRLTGTTGAHVLDGYGGLHPGADSAVPSPATPYFGFDVARDLELATVGLFVLDGFGGVHVGAGEALPMSPTPYFGFDVAVDLELSAIGYYVLDAWGGVHRGGQSIAMEPATPYFFFDAARDLELLGGGIYVLDAFGGVHAGGGAAIIAPATAYFGFDIARDMELVGEAGYYVLDGFGGVHAAGNAPAMMAPMPYFGVDAGVDLELVAVGYYVLDIYGGIHAGGGAPAMNPATPYFGFDIARDLEIE